MSNRSILERLLRDVDKYDSSRENRDEFAQKVFESIDSLENIPYEIRLKARDWQYKIETEGYHDQEGFESEIDEVIPQLKLWVEELSLKHG